MKLHLTAQNAEPATRELNPSGAKPNIVAETSKPRQKVLGFGGAFTESAAFTLSKMSAKNRQKVIDLYFGENGLNYTLGRVSIASCDFSKEPYDYIEDGDKTLKTFDMSREKLLVLPLIEDAQKATNKKITILASPWTPPAFMKDNQNRLQGGRLLPEFYNAWAQYFVKYITTVRNWGIDLQYVTIQNEPDAKQTWDSCLFSAEQERDFVKVLGKALQDAKIDINILIHDHNRDILFDRAKTIYDDKEAAQYIWGAAIHWYVSEAFSEVGKTHDYAPEKHILFTEGCQEGGVHLNDWSVAERYARNIIGDMNNYTEGYIDWNLTLDEKGGPNHVGNLCDAPIICDTVNDTVNVNPSFTYIGHFSKHIKPGATILETTAPKALQALSAQNQDGTRVTVILNETDAPQEASTQGASFEMPPHSIATITA